MQMLSPTLRRRLNPLPVASTQTETVSLDEDEEEVNESEQAEETDAGQQAVDEFSKSPAFPLMASGTCCTPTPGYGSA